MPVQSVEKLTWFIAQIDKQQEQEPRDDKLEGCLRLDGCPFKMATVQDTDPIHNMYLTGFRRW